MDVPLRDVDDGIGDTGFGILIYGLSGKGKTCAVAELIKEDPKSTLYIYNEAPGLLALKTRGVTKLRYAFAENPKQMLDLTKEAIESKFQNVVIDSLSTYHDQVMDEFDKKEPTKKTMNAWGYGLNWVETLLFRCLDCMAQGKNVILLCHEKVTVINTDQDQTKAYSTPILAGQLPERVAKKLHYVAQAITVRHGGKTRYLLHCPVSPSYGKDLDGKLESPIDNDVRLLLPGNLPQGGASTPQGQATQTPDKTKKIQSMHDAPPSSPPQPTKQVEPAPEPSVMERARARRIVKLKKQVPDGDEPITIEQRRYLQQICRESGQPTVELRNLLKKKYGITKYGDVPVRLMEELTLHFTGERDALPEDQKPEIDEEEITQAEEEDNDIEYVEDETPF